MKFLNFLHSTKLNKRQLLDIALILSLFPHLFILKFPMLVYLVFSIIFIIKKKNSKVVVTSFTLLGIIAIGLSFFAEYNFSNFSRLLVFVSALSSILIYAVVLQRLTREINFHLLISPALLMILSFFFFNSISMLFYALFTLFSFTFLILYARMQSSLSNILRINGLLYLFSLPIVVLLFLTFPRISYKKASFGFKAEQIKRTGHDGTMQLGSGALLVPSPKIVMEVSFEKEVPQSGSLYFRGSVLYEDRGSRWIEGDKKRISPNKIMDIQNIINYKVKLYAHLKRWVYMLDVPLIAAKGSVIDQDFVSKSFKPISDTLFYDGRSAVSYTMPTKDSTALEQALKVDLERDPITADALAKIVDIDAPENIKVKQLLEFFSSMDLSYSLKPKPIDLEHPIDSFLFDSKIGYCVHFASAFASSARMIGLPSRIITGYKGDRTNAINNYLLVKEADAHAWVELYLKDRGWVRFEPTATARRVLVPDNPALSNSYTTDAMNLSLIQKLFKQANIYYMYSRYVINNWILQYSRIKQMSLLNDLLTNTLFLLKFIGSIIGLIVACIVVFLLLQKRKCDDPLLCEMQILTKVLKGMGIVRCQGETMFDFLKRVELKRGNSNLLEEINRLYHQLRYSNLQEKDGLTHLRVKILALKKAIKNG